ncbi:hypothetical protein TNCV_3662481 [Trichonephila clavipes]|nr:hypothetical protein TNCV_3662481 [Trichonephila clavipes]
MFDKVSVLLDCPTVSSEVFIAVDDDNRVRLTTDRNICSSTSGPKIAPNYGKDILKSAQSSKSIIDEDFDDENEMSNVSHVPTSSEMRNIMKSTRGYLESYSNDEMNNNMHDVKQFGAKKDNAKEKTSPIKVHLNAETVLRNPAATDDTQDVS